MNKPSRKIIRKTPTSNHSLQRLWITGSFQARLIWSHICYGCNTSRVRCRFKSWDRRWHWNHSAKSGWRGALGRETSIWWHCDGSETWNSRLLWTFSWSAAIVLRRPGFEWRQAEAEGMWSERKSCCDSCIEEPWCWHAHWNTACQREHERRGWHQDSLRYDEGHFSQWTIFAGTGTTISHWWAFDGMCRPIELHFWYLWWASCISIPLLG